MFGPYFRWKMESSGSERKEVFSAGTEMTLAKLALALPCVKLKFTP